MIGLDIETTALDPSAGRIRLVQLGFPGGKAQVFDLYGSTGFSVWKELAKDHEFVAHNAVFERKWIKHTFDMDIGVIHDTMIMSQVLYTGTKATKGRGFSHSLASAVQRELTDRDGQGGADERLGRPRAHEGAEAVRGV